MKEYKGIGFTIPSANDNFVRLDSFTSLADSDIAIFCPDLSTTSYSTYDSSNYHSSGEYEGKKLYNKESSASIKEHLKHWKKELLHFVETGRTLFVVLPQKSDFFVYTGTKDLSGTGRNQKTTYHVSPFSNYSFIPFSFLEFHTASGKNVFPKSDLAKEFFNQFKDLITYEVYLTSQKELQGLFTTKNGDRILGTIVKIKDGYVVFLPNLNFNDQVFSFYNKEKDEEYWTEEAIKRGKILINSLVSIDKSLRSEKVKTPKPAWLEKDEFSIENAIETKRIIKKIKNEIEKKTKELKELNSILEEQENLKDLLFETGKPLELAVIKALRILGYKAENYDDGELELDQIILSPEGFRFIGECEGKDNKDIDVSKFRQLLDGLNADFEKESVIEKAFGLLFGNPQRFVSPNERTLNFTLKCKSGAKREKIGLIKTSDLFIVCKIVLEKGDDEFAKKCRDAIINQMGGIIIFPDHE
ncbi:hypothetical protein [Peijinzhouia sedimentorum]